jgi:hypothetical protein
MSRLAIAVLSLGLLPLAPAQEPPRGGSDSWLPLTAGNYWIYELQGGGSTAGVRMAVGAPFALGGKTYYRLDNPFGDDALVRETPEGRLVVADPKTGTERIWYDFGAHDEWNMEGRTCEVKGVIKERGSRIETPAGEFDDTLRMAFRGPCADAGVIEEVFAAGVGLVEHEEASFAGPRRYRLRKAQVDGRTVMGARAALKVQLQVDKAVYRPDLMPPVNEDRAVPTLHAAFRIENPSDEPFEIDFPSGQQFDARVIGPSGEVLYAWSANRLFAQSETRLELGPGVKEFKVEIPLGNPGTTEPWPPGRYRLRAWLPTGPQPDFEAQIAFEISEPTY